MSYAKILIADDDPDCLELLEHALHSPGAELVRARDGGELLQLLAEDGPFDLIVTDLNMPWMEGLQVLASARSAGLNTPVLVITGLTRPDLAAAIAQVGNARLLRKPFEIAALRNVISDLLQGEPRG
jgi:two-component system, cell cycle response regulator CpdR